MPSDSRANDLKRIKSNNLKKAYRLFKAAEQNGTLRQVVLTEEQKLIIRPTRSSQDSR